VPQLAALGSFLHLRGPDLTTVKIQSQVSATMESPIVGARAGFNVAVEITG
jgi:hypothetical protein